ncbi:MAG: tetratricopeptide repeat protein, partial [Candidatus Eisenbacteria sp.]|nr:tetratricopeptide repeat protein [Candidatus Eisenbacteria bacterium]
MLIITGESVSLGNLVALAESERAGGHFGEALKQAQVVIARNPNYSSGQLVAGRCHLEMGEFRLALELLGRAVEIDGDNTLALRLLGDALALSGMRQEAEAVYERGGAASGDSQGVELARKILSMGKSDPAHQDAEEERAGIIRGSMNPAEMLDAADLELKGAFGTATMAQICE